MEQSGQLVGLITRRSSVQIRSPRPNVIAGQNGKSSGLLFYLPCGKPCFWVEYGSNFSKKNFSTHIHISFILRGAIFERLARLPSLDWFYPTTAVAFFLEFVKRPPARPDSHCCYCFPEIVFIYMGHLQFCCATKLKMSLLHSKKDKAVGAIICPRLS